MNGIIVGIDGSTEGAAALRWAVDHGNATGQPVTAVLAWGYVDLGVGAELDETCSSPSMAERALERFVTDAIGDGPASAVRRLTSHALPVPTLIDAMSDASLLVVGARGLGGFRELLLGSVSRRVLHHATCPIAVIRAPAAEPDGPIVVGLDGSEPSLRALTWAVRTAAPTRAPLVAVHAWYLPTRAVGVYSAWPDPADLNADAQRFARQQVELVDTSNVSNPIECRGLSDQPAAALLASSQAASMVVVGASGHGRIAHLLLGSVSDQVAQHAACPVIVVP